MSELSIGCPEATASRISRARASESAFCARAPDTWVFRSVSCWFDSVTLPLPKYRLERARNASTLPSASDTLSRSFSSSPDSHLLAERA